MKVRARNAYGNVTGITAPKNLMKVTVSRPKAKPIKPTMRRSPRGV